MARDVGALLHLVAAGGILLSACALGQEVVVRSEFQRMDRQGVVLPSDRSESPREILSPALARNGYASFHVVVSGPPGEVYYMYVVQNPDDTVETALYRELHENRAGLARPYRLVPAGNPSSGKFPTAPPGGPEWTAEVFWLDVRVPPTQTSQRMRLEVQLNVGSRWIIYPMEPRILTTTVPDHQETDAALPGIEAPADAPALGPLLAYVCGKPEGAGKLDGLTVPRLIRRNAVQDVALARQLEAKRGRGFLSSQILEITGAPSRDAWCASPAHPRKWGAEWYLHLRDRLYRAGADPNAEEP